MSIGLPVQPALFNTLKADDARFEAPGSLVSPSSSRGVCEENQCQSPRKPRPALAICNLGSGSGGNCTVLRYADRHLLLDAGFGPRVTVKRLAQLGLTLDDISGICVTHFDTDHFRKSWVRTMADLGITLFCHHWHLPDLRRVQNNQQLFDAGLVMPFDHHAFQPLPGLNATTTRLQHDRQGTIAYRFDTEPKSAQASTDHYQRGVLSLGYATDMGHAPPEFLLHMAGVDLLCIESNYDEHMTTTSSRPAWVNRRNLSDSGHLSNDQAFEAVRTIAQISPHGNPRRVVLLHRSSQCNHATKVRRCFEKDACIAKRVIQTQQRRRTRWIQVSPLKAVRRLQMTLQI